LGWLDSMFTVSYGFGQIPSGILCDWFGPHALLGSIIFMWSISMGLVALAGGYSTMILARLAFGATQAGCYPTLSKITKLWFPLSVRTSVQGWVATFFGRGGGAVSYVLFGTVLMGWLELTWRQALGVLTLLGLLFGVVFAWFFRNRPADHPRANAAEVLLVTAGDPDAAEATRSKLRWRTVAKSGNMWVFFLQQFTSAYADTIYVFWIPLFLLTVKGADVKEAGWMAAIPLAGGAIGGMLGGVLQNHFISRTGNRRWSRSLIGMTGKLLATVFMFASLGFDSAVVIVCFFFWVKFFGDWSQPTVWGTVTDVAGKNSASMFGTVNTVGSVAGFLAGPTMGAIILGFSTQHAIVSETLAPLPADPNLEPAAIQLVSYAGTDKKDVVLGSLTAEVQGGTAGRWGFRVTEQNEFELTGDTNLDEVPLDLALCRFDAIRGRIKLAFTSESPPPDLVVSYSYREYGDGWNALFIALGLIYLISSLSWLFIDCTKVLEVDEADQDS